MRSFAALGVNDCSADEAAIRNTAGRLVRVNVFKADISVFFFVSNNP